MEQTLKTVLVFVGGRAGEQVAVPAVDLAKGVLNAMFLNKLKTVTATVMAVVVLALGVGAMMYRAEAADPRPVAKVPDADGISTTQVQISVLALEVETVALPLLGLKAAEPKDTAPVQAVSQVLTGTEMQRILEALKALCALSHAKILAEPRLVTLSGREAMYQSGGQVPLTALSPEGLVRVSFEDYGTKLRLLPVVTGSKIGLELDVELSELIEGKECRGAGQEFRLNSDQGIANSFVLGKLTGKVHAAAELTPGTTLAIHSPTTKGSKRVQVYLITPEVVPIAAAPVTNGVAPFPKENPQSPPTTPAFESLVTDLDKKSPSVDQAVEALVLAVLGRYPTETEKSLLGDALGQAKDRREGLTRALKQLTATKEFRDHAAALAEQARRSEK